MALPMTLWNYKQRKQGETSQAILLLLLLLLLRYRSRSAGRESTVQNSVDISCNRMGPWRRWSGSRPKRWKLFLGLSAMNFTGNVKVFIFEIPPHTAKFMYKIDEILANIGVKSRCDLRVSKREVMVIEWSWRIARRRSEAEFENASDG
ncbi:hypothetical protein C8J57DRAFT_1218488 [Mycena rebaudengoi]|nr:hypothetical protein C8J57DRAFT_1218488 [Mycena rebaudengoi]